MQLSRLMLGQGLICPFCSGTKTFNNKGQKYCPECEPEKSTKKEKNV